MVSQKRGRGGVNSGAQEDGDHRWPGRGWASRATAQAMGAATAPATARATETSATRWRRRRQDCKYQTAVLHDGAAHTVSRPSYRPHMASTRHAESLHPLPPIARRCAGVGKNIERPTRGRAAVPRGGHQWTATVPQSSCRRAVVPHHGANQQRAEYMDRGHGRGRHRRGRQKKGRERVPSSSASKSRQSIQALPRWKEEESLRLYRGRQGRATDKTP